MNVLVDEFNVTHPGQVDFIAIPTNNFGLQEPGANNEILNGLEHVRPGGGFKPKYKVAEKNEANGINADPLFVYLKESCLAPQGVISDPGSLYYSPVSNDDITWNFEKFLIDQNGKPYRRYTPDAYPLAQMRTDILYLLNNTETTEPAKDKAKLTKEKIVPKPVEIQEPIKPVEPVHENESHKPARRQRKPQHMNKQKLIRSKYHH